ncbi:MAG TPA: DUF3365 domain-containing protein [Pelomicrobium sp.]|nr:DUF3365 domain-containing protein [Pelomicrobium sp.]
MRLSLLIAAALATAPAAAADTAKMVEEGRQVSAAFMKALAGELQREMKAGGPVQAIGVCKDEAPQIASELSREHGYKISRVSLKTRNPVLGTPDAWEQKVLMEFDRKAAAGTDPKTLEASEVVAEPTGKYFRYMKAIPVGEVCVACHGPADKVADAVKAKLAQEYPHDRALGYNVGQIRGAFTVKRPLE